MFNSKHLFLFLAVVALLALPVQSAEFAQGKTCYQSNFTTTDCTYALDSNNATRWMTNNTQYSGLNQFSNMTVDLDGTAIYNVTNVEWRGYDGTSTYGYSNISVAYSNDNFTTQQFVGNIVGNTIGTRVFNFTNGIRARYWRIIVNGAYGDTVYGYTSNLGIYGSTVTLPNATVTLSAPTNTTYVQANVTSTFTVNTTYASSAVCYNGADTTQNLRYLVASGATNTLNLTGLSNGQHTNSISCVPSIASSSSFYTPTTEGTGTPIDYAGYRNLSIGAGVSWGGSSNAPTWGNVLNFTGSQSDVNTTSFSRGTSNATYEIALWNAANCGTGYSCNNTLPRAWNHGNIELSISNSTGALACAVTVNSTITATSGAIGKKTWNHVICTWSNDGNNATVQLWLNGALNASTSLIGGSTNMSGSSVFRIGQVVAVNRAWNGMLARPAVWTRTLNNTEIAWEYYLYRTAQTNVTSEQINGANGTVFTRTDWLQQQTANPFTTPVYETTEQTFNTGLNVSENIANVVASLYYNTTINGTNTTVTTTAYTSGKQLNYTRNVTLTLLTTNNTNTTAYWSFNLTYLNGTTIVVNDTSATQVSYYNYYPGTLYVNPNPATEGEPIEYNMSATTVYSTSATLTSTMWLNATSELATLVGTNYTAQIYAPAPPSDPAYYNGVGSLNITWGGLSYIRNSSTVSVSVYLVSLGNCNGTNPVLMNFTFKDEETLTDIYATMGITAILYNSVGTVAHTYNFSYTNVTNATICASISGNYYLDTVQDYYSNANSTTYPMRHYYISNGTANTTTPTTVNLYLLSSSYAYLTEYTLQTQAGLPAEDYTLQILRYYPSLNQYLLIGMGKTDSNGNTGVYLRPNDVSIKVYAYENSTDYTAFPAAPVTCAPGSSACTVTLILTSGALESSGKIAGVTGSCDNTTVLDISYISCSYLDPTGTLSQARLVVWELGGWANTTFCDTSSTSASGALSCTLGNLTATEKSYQYAFSTAFSPPGQKYGGFVITTPHPDNYGSFGALLSSLIILGIGLSGTVNPPLTIVGTLIGFTFAYVMGFTFIAWPAFIGLLIVGVIALYSASK